MKSLTAKGKTKDAPAQAGLFSAPAESFIGIGTSNKPIEKYIQELKDANIRVVVDVRGAPFSRFYPQFNRDSLRQSLKQAGINYVWLGDSLGNPKDAQGQRSLEGFRDYMKTDDYKRGLAELENVMDENEDSIAITCAEGAESECHRKFILEDLRKRRGKE